MIQKIGSHCFAGWKDDTTFDLQQVTRIVGGNSAGKTTMANAITAFYYNCNYWGKTFCPLNNGSISWLNVDIDDKHFKRIWQQKSKTLSSSVSESVALPEKNLGLSILNPRYWFSLGPAEAKNVLFASIAKRPMIIFIPDGFDDFVDEQGYEEKYSEVFTVADLVSFISDVVKTASDRVAEIKKKLIGAEFINEYCKAKALTYSYGTINENLENDLSDARAFEKECVSWRKKIEKLLIADINSKFINLQIVTENADGKDTFEIYNGYKFFKTMSNTEQLQTGLELANVLAGNCNADLPCIIDNAEAVAKNAVKFSDYTNIDQFFVLTATNTAFGSVENGNVMEPTTRKVVDRIPEEILVRDVTFVDGWGC